MSLVHYAVALSLLTFKVEWQCCLLLSAFGLAFLKKAPLFWGGRWNCGPPNGVPHGAKREFQAWAQKKKEAQARNLVALTRSKGLCILLLPILISSPTPPSTFSALSALFAMACSALAPPPLICQNWGPSSRNRTSLMTEPLASTQLTPGKWHIKSPGMERGIASHLLSRSPMPNTPFASLSSSGMEWCLRAMYASWKPRPLSGGVLSLIILAPPLALRVMDSSYRLSSPWSSSLFLLEGGPPPFLPPSLQGTMSGLYPARISLPMLLLTKGILIPSALGCMTLMTFPFHLRWSGGLKPPSVAPVALATPSQQNPVPSWLPTDSKTLSQQGLEALTTSDALHKAAAYCAHALHNFSEEHLSILANPDTLASFNTEVIDPLLNSETCTTHRWRF